MTDLLYRYFTRNTGVWKRKGRVDVPPFVPPVVDSFVLGTTKPSALNTGVPAGTTLTAYTGPSIISTAGTVIENKLITNTIDVRAANVVIRNCKFETPNGGGAIVGYNVGCVNLLIERCTMRAIETNNSTGITGHDYTALRCDVSGYIDGFGCHNSYTGTGGGYGVVRDSKVFVHGNYVHDFCYVTPYPTQQDNESHNDGIQVEGMENVSIIGNFFSSRGDTTGIGNIADNPRKPYTLACIIITPNVSPVNGLKIRYNWLDGGYAPLNISQKSYGEILNLDITGNRWSGQKALSADALVASPTRTNQMQNWTGNIREDTGNPVVFNQG